ncbi:phage Gp37/Gp68 family protein [Burkholderia stabilis]|uniref:Phage Gp37/Gp68 family protein n=1 Tax=Burkholderia stabilis TaxID=95485 RepID=A0A4Q2A4X3_9BURK|nr:phage Gp37/Gp68 family protein [Burkholderia stabilis]RXV64157.1 phage Gp37/Gp68 family protein [Burkholderia stabilis]
MSENTKIEWCDHTWSPWEGCQKVGPGCDHCYAEARNARFGGGTPTNWGPGAPRRRTAPNSWKLPLRWDRKAGEMGKRLRIFPSLCDPFDNAVDPAWRVDFFRLIAKTPNLDWLLLTKRIGNAREMLNEIVHELSCGLNTWDELPWPGIWLGATIVNRAEMLRDAERLLAVPCRIHFWSVEPMLGDLGKVPPEMMPDWIICGGESGPGARPTHPEWPRALRDQCADAGVPFHFKQWGQWHTDAFLMSTGEPVFRQFDSFQQWVNKASTWVNGGVCLDRSGNVLRNGGDFMRARDAGDFPVTVMHRTGKRAAGRLLDGRTHDEFPEAR